MPALAMNLEENEDYKVTMQAVFEEPEDFQSLSLTSVAESLEEELPQSYTRSILRTGWSGFTTIIYYVWMLIFWSSAITAMGIARPPAQYDAEEEEPELCRGVAQAFTQLTKPGIESQVSLALTSHLACQTSYAFSSYSNSTIVQSLLEPFCNFKRIDPPGRDEIEVIEESLCQLEQSEERTSYYLERLEELTAAINHEPLNEVMGLVAGERLPTSRLNFRTGLGYSPTRVVRFNRNQSWWDLDPAWLRVESFETSHFVQASNFATHLEDYFYWYNFKDLCLTQKGREDRIRKLNQLDGFQNELSGPNKLIFTYLLSGRVQFLQFLNRLMPSETEKFCTFFPQTKLYPETHTFFDLSDPIACLPHVKDSDRIVMYQAARREGQDQLADYIQNLPTITPGIRSLRERIRTYKETRFNLLRSLSFRRARLEGIASAAGRIVQTDPYGLTLRHVAREKAKILLSMENLYSSQDYRILSKEYGRVEAQFLPIWNVSSRYPLVNAVYSESARPYLSRIDPYPLRALEHTNLYRRNKKVATFLELEESFPLTGLSYTLLISPQEAKNLQTGQAFATTIQDGLVYNNRISPSEPIELYKEKCKAVIGPDETFYVVSNLDHRVKDHTGILKGMGVIWAGEVSFNRDLMPKYNTSLQFMDNSSGHYLPPSEALDNGIEVLKKQDLRPQKTSYYNNNA